MKESYLDKFMNMVVNHLMRRHARNLLQLIRSHDLSSTNQGLPSIRLDAGPYLPFPFIPGLALLCMRSNLLEGKVWGSSPPLVQGRGGRTFLCRIFLFLFFNNLHPLLANARERLILLHLDLGVQLLVEFFHHLYTKKKK